MESGFEELIARLEKQFKSNGQEQDILRRLARNIEAVLAAMEELIADGNFVVQYHFDEATQILYNKERFPALLSKLILYRKLVEVETLLRYSTAEKGKEFCENELGTILQFFTAHRDFQEYYYSGQTTDDWHLYTSLNKESIPLPYSESISPPFNHPGCQLKSYLLAYQEYHLVLKSKLDSVSGATPKIGIRQERISWQGQQIDLVELLLALYEAETIDVDGQPATLEFLFQLAASIFCNIDTTGLHGSVKGVRNRKKGAAQYLLVLISALEGRMERAFTDQPRKRR